MPVNCRISTIFCPAPDTSQAWPFWECQIQRGYRLNSVTSKVHLGGVRYGAGYALFAIKVGGLGVIGVDDLGWLWIPGPDGGYHRHRNIRGFFVLSYQGGVLGSETNTRGLVHWVDHETVRADAARFNLDPGSVNTNRRDVVDFDCSHRFNVSTHASNVHPTAMVRSGNNVAGSRPGSA